MVQEKQYPRVVAMAGGVDKAQAIKGALAGGCINVLIIDKVTAKIINLIILVKNGLINCYVLSSD